MDITFLSFVILIVCMALAFDFVNGFHDASNSIATIVATGVLTPRQAVLWAAFFNFIAMFIFAPKVADTISKIVIMEQDKFEYMLVIISALMGAIIWDLLTWWWKLPTSSSHALIGGLVGAGMTFGGINHIRWEKVLYTFAFIPLAPLLGFCLAFAFVLLVLFFLHKWKNNTRETFFRRAQFVSAALYSIGHGGNDAQKTMGIIVALLLAAGVLLPDVKLSLFDSQTSWIIISCHLAMALGTLLGGWRIVHTLGYRITQLRPEGGFCAETAGASTLFIATYFGIPVSTTHTITGAISAVGAVKKEGHVNWKLLGLIVWTWILTIPCAAIIAGVFYQGFYLLYSKWG